MGEEPEYGVAAADFDEEAAPRRKPELYPGVWPAQSVVVSASQLWKVTDREGASLAWADTPPVRLGVARARDITDADRRGAPTIQLNRLAEEEKCALMDRRAPVLAIGSNAAPSQLRYKFRDRPEALFIPSIRAQVSGVAVGYMPVMSQFHYIPATVFPAGQFGADDGDGVADPLILAVQFLDDRQLIELDESESPFYRRVWLGPEQGVTVQLETGEVLPGAYAYVASGGVLIDADGQPVLMNPPAATGLDQVALIESLRADPDVKLPEPNALDRYPRAKVGEALAAAGRVHPENPFFDLPDEMGHPPLRYGALAPIGDIEAVRGGPDGLPGEQLAWVDASPDGIERGGQSVIRLNRVDLERLGNPKLVAIRSARLATRHGDAAPVALAAVHPYDPKDPPEPEVGHVQTDHVLRMGCGLERGDPVAIRPAHVERNRLFDPMIGRPTHLTMRVTLADPASAERDVVLMSRLAIDILGLESGDYVVMEGTPAADGTVPAVVLKVFEVPADVEDNRRAVTGGSWGARFPAATETLGINQDLPMAFIDAELRARLNVSGQTLATVRVRPGRGHRFGVEMREMLLVLAIALMGIVQMFNDQFAVQLVILVVLLGLSAVLVIGRMRRRLAHGSKFKEFRPRRRK